MSRLTTKTSIMGNKHDLLYGKAYLWKEKLKDLNYSVIEKAIDKLGQLEDIEEALGIDLETLFYGIMKGIYIYDEDEDCIYSYVIDNIKYIKHGWGTCTPWGTYILFEDYGDTWALTREELENE